MAEKTRFKGTILGKELTITANESQAHMKAVFDLANAQLDKMQQAAPKLDDNQLLTIFSWIIIILIILAMIHGYRLGLVRSLTMLVGRLIVYTFAILLAHKF